MNDNSILKNQLNDLVKRREYKKLSCFIKENMILLFSTPDIPIYYSILKDIPYTDDAMSKLILGWMSFLSGDHLKLFSILNEVNEPDLHTKEELSVFYSLKAMIGYMMNPQEGLNYSKQSIDVLENDQSSFYMANALLTYGQLLASSQKYRLAYNMFNKAYKIFYTFNLSFLSIVALANEMLNRIKLGEMHYVINKCKEIQLMHGSYTEETNDYHTILSLPLGMCYYELNKPNLAIEHLIFAIESITKYKLFHMHGLIELYIFKSYQLLNRWKDIKKLQDKIAVTFAHMNYKKIDYILSLIRIYSQEQEDNQSIQSDIEYLEYEYQEKGENCNLLVLDALAYLKIKGLSQAITSEKLEKRLEKLKYIGFIPEIQQVLTQLAEMNYKDGDKRKSEKYLKEAVQIYKDHGISARFHTMQLDCVHLLQKIDNSLYNVIRKKKYKQENLPHGNMLSAREKEIMQLIAVGKTNKEISNELFISVGTIKWHINNIFSKLYVKNRVQAIEKAKSLSEISS